MSEGHEDVDSLDEIEGTIGRGKPGATMSTKSVTTL